MPSISDALKALKHDMRMEAEFAPMAPIEQTRKVAAKVLDVPEDSVYVVMFSFVLGSYKAWCSSNALKCGYGQYAEVVYNHEKHEWYGIRYIEDARVTIGGTC